jgi:5'-3' exonuclease
MKLLLVDLSAVFWRNWHASKDQEIGSAYENTVAKIAGYKRNYDRTIVCGDWGPYKRKAISADYKAQRDAPDPVAVGQLKRVKERVLADGMPISEALGYEADDIIATICAKLGGDESPWTIDILTADKDLMALVDERITIVHLASGDRFGPDEVLAKMGVDPCKVSELLALTGDKADNVPGCPSIGPKKAVRLLADNGGIVNILDGDPVSIICSETERNLLTENRENISKSFHLVTLMTDAPINIDDLLKQREVKPLSIIDDAEFEEELPSSDAASPVPVAKIEPPKPEPVKKEEPKPAEVVAKETALAVIPQSFEMTLEPTSFNAAWTLAKVIHSSRLFAVENPEQAFMIVMTGREMGIGAMTSLRGFHFIKGKPCLSAQLMVALILKSGKCEFWELIESSSKTATYETKRVGGRNPQRKTFSVDDAKLAQLVKGDGNWLKYPAAMCEARAASALARIVYPDLMMGVYLPEELED